MDYVIAILVFGSIFLFLVYQLREQHERWKRIKAEKLPTKVPLTDDCIEASKMLNSFLRARILEMNGNLFSTCDTGVNSGLFTLIDSHDIPDLIRIAHVVGYQVVLERVSDTDIENSENTREKLKKYHVSLTAARRRRINRQLGLE